MTTAQVVEASVTVNNSPIQDYVHPDDQTQPTFVISHFGHVTSYQLTHFKKMVQVSKTKSLLFC